MSKMKNTRTMLLFLLVTMISLGVSAQNVTVKGTVKDKAGETVIGASVVQKGNTGNGTILLVVGMDMYFVQGRLHLFSGHWQEQPADMWPVG